MMLVFHGGECCGIKHIYGMGCHPGAIHDKHDPNEHEAHDDEDQCGERVNSRLSFFNEDAPEETYVERLDRLIAFCRSERPQGIIEITLAVSPDLDRYYDQVTAWQPYLEARGFREVNSCMNSNSDNRVYVFHLNCE